MKIQGSFRVAIEMLAVMLASDLLVLAFSGVAYYILRHA